MRNRQNGRRPVFGREKRAMQKMERKALSSTPEAQPVVVVDTRSSDLERLIRRIFRIMEFSALALAIIGLPMLFLDLQDRKQNQITTAWQLVTTPAPGNSGKGPALSYLNRQDSWCPEWAKPALSIIFPIKEKISLSGINLSADRHGGAIDLTGVDLKRADLVTANLSGANFESANLEGANLSGASIGKTFLRYVNLSGAGLERAYLAGANLEGANLSGTNFADANLSGGFLYKANLSKAFLQGANLSGTYLAGANLAGANLAGANLAGANLAGANLAGANLSGADLSSSDFSKTEFWSQSMFDKACGNEETILPGGMTIKPCPENWQRPIPLSVWDF